MKITKKEHQKKFRTELLGIVKEIFNHHDGDIFPEADNLGMEKIFEKWTDRLIVLFKKNKGA